MATKNINTVTNTSELADTDYNFISKGGSELCNVYRMLSRRFSWLILGE